MHSNITAFALWNYGGAVPVILLLDVKLGENDVENNDFQLSKSDIVARKTMKYAWICIVKSLE